MSIPTPLCIEQNKLQTQKKSKNQQHKRIPTPSLSKNNNNLSYSSRLVMSYRMEEDPLAAAKISKLTSLNNSRLSQMSYLGEELKYKEKTLSEINLLLEKKK